MSSFRMPGAWQGKVTDQQLLTWLHDYAQKRMALPADPGSGTFKLSFRLSRNDQQLIKQLSAGETSSFLRRLIALHLGSATPTVSRPRTSATPMVRIQSPAPEQSTARNLEQRPQPFAVVSSSPSEEKQPQILPPEDMPAILYQRSPRNYYNPMFQNGEWKRGALTNEEQQAHKEFISHRMLAYQERHNRR